MSSRLIIFVAILFSLALALISVKLFFMSSSFKFNFSNKSDKEEVVKSKTNQGIILSINDSGRIEVEFPDSLYIVTLEDIIWPKNKKKWVNEARKIIVPGTVVSFNKNNELEVYFENLEKRKLSSILILKGFAFCSNVASDCAYLEDSARRSYNGVWSEIFSRKEKTKKETK